MPGRVLLARGPDEDEEELERIVLWAPEDEGAGSSGISQEVEDGSGPPL